MYILAPTDEAIQKELEGNELNETMFVQDIHLGLDFLLKLMSHQSCIGEELEQLETFEQHRIFGQRPSQSQLPLYVGSAKYPELYKVPTEALPAQG